MVSWQCYYRLTVWKLDASSFVFSNIASCIQNHYLNSEIQMTKRRLNINSGNEGRETRQEWKENNQDVSIANSYAGPMSRFTVLSTPNTVYSCLFILVLFSSAVTYFCPPLYMNIYLNQTITLKRRGEFDNDNWLNLKGYKYFISTWMEIINQKC